MNDDEEMWPEDDQNEGWDYDDQNDEWPDEDADMELEMQIPQEMKKAGSLNSIEIQSFTVQELIDQQIPGRVAAANEILFLDNDRAISVLRHFDWNQAKMEEQWFGEDQEKLKIKIGIEYDNSLDQKYPEITERLAKNNNNMCNVMFMDFDPDDDDMRADSLICGHQFSAICWTQHLREKVRSQGAICMFAKCPQLRCNVVVPHSIFLKYLKDDVIYEDGINYFQRYNKWHCKQFTEFNKNIRWCPQPECENVVYKSDFATKNEVTCKCGREFCFQCNHEHHVPATCENVDQWAAKENDEEDSLVWIKANTKKCPKCETSIEKNQGCQSMACSKCKYQFCWFCLKASHGHNIKCGQYEQVLKSDKDLQNKVEEQKKNQRKLQIYQLHFERYMDHQKSKEICKQQILGINQKVKLLHEIKNYPSNELLFFEKCSKQIILCRQVLKWSYPVSYFAIDVWSKGDIHLFKFQQDSLEAACSDVHQILESELDPFLDVNEIDRGPFYKYKSNLINKMEILKNSYETFIVSIYNNESKESQMRKSKSKKVQEKKEEKKEKVKFEVVKGKKNNKWGRDQKKQ